jgi:hypothetical protein
MVIESLVNAFSGSIPTSLANEARKESPDRIRQPGAAAGVKGPPHEQRSADDLVSGQSPPKAAIVAPVAVVPHDEKVIGRHLEGVHVISRPEVFLERLFENGVGFVQRLLVDVDLLGSYFNAFAGKPNNPLDVVFGSVGLIQILEHDNVSTTNLSKWQEAGGGSTFVVTKSELVDEKVISRQ